MGKYSISLGLVVIALAGCSAAANSSRNGQAGGNAGTSAGNNGDGGTGLGSNLGNSNGGTTLGPTVLPDGAVGQPPAGVTSPFVQDDTSKSGLDAATLDGLKKGGGACSTNILYPYDKTVFPRGLPAPSVMWDGGADAAYVHLRFDKQANVDYQFAAGPSNPGELVIPQDAWNKIVARSDVSPLLVTLSVKSGGTISTCETSWKIAPGTMSGALYYNTYNAPGAMFSNNGAVMRLTLGNDKSDIYLQDLGAKNLIPSTGPCVSCHSVSFDGSMLVASKHDYQAKTFQVSSYKVQQALQPAALSPLPNANFGALYPDGTRMLTMGNPDCTGGAETFPRAPRNMPFVEGPSVATMIDTATGQPIATKGLDPTFYMWMPQFSPDGKHVVFNHAKPAGTGTDRRQLAVMDYDYATNTFSNLKVVVQKLGPDPSQNYAPGGTAAGFLPAGKNGCTLPAGQEEGQLPTGTCTGPCYPAWPFFTPDNRGVVFLLINQPDFASAFPGRETSSMGELWYADIPSGQTVRLDNANKGLKAADATENYYPTVLPVAIGGYYWVFWTAKRDYGNKVFKMPTLSGIPTTLVAEQDAVRKRIWLTALQPLPKDTEFPTGLKDISAPGFFVTGQSESGNVRAFTTLNPCTKSGDTSTCKSGLDCCSGYCFIPPQTSSEFDVTPTGHCSEIPPSCSLTNDRCLKDADCCAPTNGKPQNTCIGGYCTFITVPQ